MMNKSEELNESEALFESLCMDKKILYTKLETGDKPTPDYEITLEQKKIIVEVKEITPNQDDDKSQQQMKSEGWYVLSNTPGKRVRKKIEKGNRQLKARTKGCHPGLLILYNKPITNYLGLYDIKTAMYGFDTEVITKPRDMNPPHIIDRKSGSKRRMTPDNNTSTSAIGVLTNHSKTSKLQIFHNIYAQVPLSYALLKVHGFQQFTLDQKHVQQFQNWIEIS